jgi:hypothetical protein
MIDWGDIISDIIREALPVVVMAVVVYLGALARKLFPVLQERYETALTKDQRQILETIVRAGVSYAEQIWKREDVQQEFASKKHAAFSFIDGQLEKYGIRDVSMNEIEALIEAAVWQEINRAPKVETIVNNAELVATGSPAVEVTPPIINAGAIGAKAEELKMVAEKMASRVRKTKGESPANPL